MKDKPSGAIRTFFSGFVKRIQGAPLRKRLLSAILAVALIALAVSYAVTAVGISRVSSETLKAGRATTDMLLANVLNGLYQADGSTRVSAVAFAARSLADDGEPVALLDAAIVKMQEMMYFADEVAFLMQDGKPVAVRAILPDIIGEYDIPRLEEVLAATVDIDPSAYGIMPDEAVA